MWDLQPVQKYSGSCLSVSSFCLTVEQRFFLWNNFTSACFVLLRADGLLLTRCVMLPHAWPSVDTPDFCILNTEKDTWAAGQNRVDSIIVIINKLFDREQEKGKKLILTPYISGHDNLVCVYVRILCALLCNSENSRCTINCWLHFALNGTYTFILERFPTTLLVLLLLSRVIWIGLKRACLRCLCFGPQLVLSQYWAKKPSVMLTSWIRF